MSELINRSQGKPSIKTSGVLVTLVALLGAGCAQKQPEPSSPEAGWSEQPAVPSEHEDPAAPGAEPPALEQSPHYPEQGEGEPAAGQPPSAATDPGPDASRQATQPSARPHADNPDANTPGAPNLHPPQGPNMAPSNAGQSAQGSYSDEKVAAFARAYVDVAQIQQRYQEALQNASGPSAQNVQQQASQDMTSAIEKQPGISVEEFQRLNSTLDTDAELKRRVEAAIQDLIQ